MLFDQPPGRLAAADLAFPVAGALAVDVADGDESARGRRGGTT